MARRKTSRVGVNWLVLLGVVVCCAAGALAYYAFSRQAGPGPVSGRARVSVKPGATVPGPCPVSVTVYLPEVSGSEWYLVPARITATGTGENPALDAAVRVLIERGQTEEAGGVIPKGTRLLDPIRLTGDVATLNLSREFADNFPGGSKMETLTLNAIAHTVTANSGGQVAKVLFLIEGRPLESLGGHYSLEEPFEPEPQALKPGGDS